jgi:hypothetical protein
MKKKNLVKGLTLAIVGAVFLIGVSGAQAAPMNWTETMYTASSGETTFDWDQTSQYDLSYPDGAKTLASKLEPLGVVYDIVIPNFYDPLPMKTLEVTINGNNNGAGGSQLARVLDVLGSDSLYGVPSPALPAPGMFVNGASEPTLVSELWHIYPNPDYETVTVWVPDAFELESIKVATQSVPIPLPAAVLMLGPALFGLLVIRRKVRS